MGIFVLWFMGIFVLVLNWWSVTCLSWDFFSNRQTCEVHDTFLSWRASSRRTSPAWLSQWEDVDTQDEKVSEEKNRLFRFLLSDDGGCPKFFWVSSQQNLCWPTLSDSSSCEQATDPQHILTSAFSKCLPLFGVKKLEKIYVFQ